MTRSLFGRCWSLTIIPRAGASAIQYSSSPNQGQPLRFEFDVKRTLHSASNKGKIRLTNLSAASAALIDLGARVELRCGYGSFADDYASLVFVGDVMDKTTELQGSDFITELECADGEILLQNAVVAVSFRSKTPLAQVIQAIAKQLRVDISGQVFAPSQMVAQRLPTGSVDRFVYAGPAKKALDDLLGPRGIQWSIQNGSLLLQAQEGIIKLQATVLSAQTGLLEKPKASKKGVEFKSLLQASIEPGSAVTIVSSATEASGNFRVVEVTYKGDTHGNEWSCEGLGSELTYPLAAYVAPTEQTGDPAQASSDVDADTEGEIAE